MALTSWKAYIKLSQRVLRIVKDANNWWWIVDSLKSKPILIGRGAAVKAKVRGRFFAK